MGQRGSSLTAENIAAVDTTPKIIGYIGISNRLGHEINFSNCIQDIKLTDRVFNKPTGLYCFESSIKIKSSWPFTDQQTQEIKLSVNAIQTIIIEKRMHLRQILLQNPALPYTYWMCEAPSCLQYTPFLLVPCALAFFVYFYFPLVGLCALTVDLFLCKFCCRWREEEIRWITQQLEANPDLCSTKIDEIIAVEMQALAHRLSTEAVGYHVKYWSGVTTIEFSSGANISADEWQIQIWTSAPPNNDCMNEGV